MAVKLPVLAPVSRTRKSPFYDSAVKAGLTGVTIYNHMLLPTWFESTEKDYQAIMNGVTCWDVGSERQVEVTGPDAFELVRMMTPRNLSKLKIGQCKYIPMVNQDGGMINDPVLLRLAENHFWISLADSDILLWAQGIALGKGLDVNITEPDVSPLAIQGPKADDVAAKIFGDWVRKLKFFWFKELEFEGMPLVIARSGWSKQGGFEVYLRDGQYGAKLWDMVMEAGAEFDIKPAAPNAIERLESGLLSYGNDMDMSNNPYEIGLDKFVDLKQDVDFIGKFALQKIRAKGIKQKLVGLKFNCDPIPWNEEFWPIRSNSKGVIGKVTSSVYSPTLKTNIGLGFVPIDMTEIGTEVMIDSPYGYFSAEVHKVPFI